MSTPASEKGRRGFVPVDLSAKALASRPDAGELMALIQMMENADYWLSFEVADFEPLLTLSPAPLRALGVAIALRYAEEIEGKLMQSDLTRVREDILRDLPEDLAAGMSAAVDILERAVTVRDRVPELEAAGFQRSEARVVLNANIIQAMGRADIRIEGQPDEALRVEAPIGQPLVVSATDERGRPIDPPIIESATQPPVWMRDEDQTRSIVLMVPGPYTLRVAFKAEGARRVVAR